MIDIQNLQGRGLGNVLRNGASGVALAMALGLPGVGYAGALPNHGHFVSGQGSINKANQSLTVKQSSTTGIINWNSFSVGKHSGVTFDNGSGATLNRVTGGNLSTIAGSLHATGSLFLMNNAGVIVSGTGKVVTGGSFVASSGNIANAAFGDGDRRFKPGQGNVVNKGSIVSGGGVSLVGRNVGDSGTIQASRADLSATHRLGISGAINAQQSNGAGGTVLTRARTIFIGQNGDIDTSASAANQKGGTISVVARGATTVAGALTAEGARGGFIETSGRHVHVADSAKISTLAADGSAGTWLIDPMNFTIAASGGDITGALLSSDLASNNIKLKSDTGNTSGNGDIFVDDSVSWSSSHVLTLDAYRNIEFNSAITIKGAGGLTLVYGDQAQNGTGDVGNGDLIFNSGNVAFTKVVGGNTQGSLTINGTPYTLVNSVSQLASDIANNALGAYALAKSYNAGPDGTYGSSPIPTTFTGTLEGLGNTISNLKINDTTPSDVVGLFSVIGTGGLVRDIGLTNVNIQASEEGRTGALAGEVDGGSAIEHSYSTGVVNAGSDTSIVGGLVGYNGGELIADHSSAAVAITDAQVNATDTADVGGLVGENVGSIYSSYASGAVSDNTSSHTGSEDREEADAVLGGLVGSNDGDISNSYATGAVTGGTTDFVGGLVGDSRGGTISFSYATGNVVAAAGKAGGFIGNASGGAISGSYATGDVRDTAEGAKVGGLVGDLGGASIDTSYATGNATDVGNGTTQGSGTGTSDVGGLIGDIDSGTVTTSYATGTVVGGSDADAGGLIGLNEGTVNHSYAIGSVSGGGLVGGFVGQNGSSGTIDESYSIGKATGTVGSFVGGFAGDDDNLSGISASVGDYYNSSINTGPGVAADGGSGGSDVHGLTTAQMRTASNFSEWTDFGDMPGGSGWVIVDTDGSLDNAVGAGATTPMLLAEYSTTITNAHQLQLMELDTNATYTLSGNIDASGTAGGDVWGANGFIPVGGNLAGTFIGNFDGQGYVIDGLKEVLASGNISAGLFGVADNSTVTDVSLTNVSIKGASNNALTGGLIGEATDSTVSGVHVTGQISSGTAATIGGIIGLQQDGTVSQSSANAMITAGASTDINLSEAGEISGLLDGGTIDQSFGSGVVTGGSGSVIGGLAGFISDSGTISNSYSMAVIVGKSASAAGGIAGDEAVGTIEDSYAVGVLAGATNFKGGIVGEGGGGSGSNLVNTYWDSKTTGQSQASGFGAEAGATALTTAQLQSKLPTGFDRAVWGTGAGLFPYLRWQYPSGTPQAVSGVAFSDHGATALSAAVVSLLIGGDAMGTAMTGANGYYYFLEAPGTLSGSSVLTYLSGTGGAAFADNVTGSISGFEIDRNFLNETTAGSTYSALASDLSSAISGDSAAQSIVSSLTNLGVDYTGNATFTFDSAVNLGSGALVVDADGAVKQTAAISASKLLVLGTADYTLTNATNAIGTLAGDTTGSFNLTDNHALTIGSVAGVNGLDAGDVDDNGVSLTTTTGDITIAGLLVAGTKSERRDVTLKSAGAIAESGSGSITAAGVSGSAQGVVNLSSSTNDINSLGPFKSGGNLAFVNDRTLTIDGKIDAGTNAIKITTVGNGSLIQIDATIDAGALRLVSSGAIEEGTSAVIDATTLTGSSQDETNLSSTKNVITDLGSFSTNGHGFLLTDDAALTLNGAVNAGSGTVALTTVGKKHNLAINAALTGGTVSLATTGQATESSAGAITAKLLNVTANTGIALASKKNAIKKLGTDKTKSGPNKVNL